MTLPLHPENCTCLACQNQDDGHINDLVAALGEPGGVSLGPRMRVPGDDDEYYDIFLSKEELGRKYP